MRLWSRTHRKLAVRLMATTTKGGIVPYSRTEARRNAAASVDTDDLQNPRNTAGTQSRVRPSIVSHRVFANLRADRAEAFLRIAAILHGCRPERPLGWAGAASRSRSGHRWAGADRSVWAGWARCRAFRERLLGQICVKPRSVATALCAWSRETNASFSPGSARPGSASDATARCHASIARIACSRTSRSAVSST